MLEFIFIWILLFISGLFIFYVGYLMSDLVRQCKEELCRFFRGNKT